MMKYRLMVVAFLAFTGTALAQDPQTWFGAGCPKCGVIGWVDMPAPSTTVSRADLYAGRAAFEGWGFECVSGQPVDRIDLWIERTDGIWANLKQNANTTLYGFVYRPDVQAVFTSGCPRVTGLTGWVFYVSHLPDSALGAHRFTLVLWRGPYHINRVLTLNIVE